VKSRALEIRNACLARLAVEAGLPAPTDADVSALDTGLSLEDAWARWQASHAVTMPVPVAVPGKKRNTVRRGRWIGIGVATAALVTFTAVLAAERYRANVRDAGGMVAIPAAERWTRVTATERATLANKLLTMASSEMPVSISLSAGEFAALAFGPSQARQHVRIDSLDARIDSLLWVRGRLRGGSRFEMGARIVITRPGRAEVRAAQLSFDGVDRPAAEFGAYTAVIQGRKIPPGRDGVWIELPAFVGALHVESGGATITNRRVHILP